MDRKAALLAPLGLVSGAERGHPGATHRDEVRRTPKTGGRWRRGSAGMLRLLAAVYALGGAPPARAYDPFLHEAFPVYALTDRAGELARPVPVATDADLEALRTGFYRAAAGLPPPLSARFLARYPTVASFDAYAFKEFLGLNPAKVVWGFDRVPPPGTKTQLEAIQDGARFPESDLRAADRFYRDSTREVVRTPDGEPIPFDPMTLKMGGLTGLPSMGHAHYELARGPLSDDPEVLKTDPRHFAVPPDVQTWGADFVQTYIDLALLARASGLPGGPYLARIYEGTGFLHLADICNQIHTVQVGLYDFFYDATLEAYKDRALKLFGLLGTPESFRTIGVRILANHHTLSEALFAKRMKALLAGAPPGRDAASLGLRGALSALSPPRRVLEEQLSAAAGMPKSARELLGTPFAMRLAEEVVEISSPEGSDVYRHIRAAAVPALSGRQGRFDKDHDDPDRFLRDADPEVAMALQRFYVLQVRALVRVGAALRALDSLLELTSGPDAQLKANEPAVVTRLVATQLDYLDAAEARRRVYLVAKKMPVAERGAGVKGRGE